MSKLDPSNDKLTTAETALIYALYVTALLGILGFLYICFGGPIGV